MSETAVERMETDRSEGVDTVESDSLPVVNIKQEIVDENIEENVDEMESTTDDKATAPLKADVNDDGDNGNTAADADANAHANAKANGSNGTAIDVATTDTNQMDTEEIEENQPDSAEKQVKLKC